MSQARNPDSIFDPRSAALPARVLVTRTAVQLVAEVAQHLITEAQAERHHVRALEARGAAEGARTADLDRLERIASSPGVAAEQQVAAVELMLDLIADRHGAQVASSLREA
jgi:hypothetical protein